MSFHKVPHAAMFHHFHGVGHKSGQGSISSDQFADILDWLQQKYTVLDAHDFQAAALSGTLEPSDVCLSFDDALRQNTSFAALLRSGARTVSRFAPPMIFPLGMASRHES